MLQAEQINPVPYRPQMIGLVERFHRTWKDYTWFDFAVYAYNSGKHTTVSLSPYELMMGRRLRPPNELLRQMSVSEAGELTAYHQRLLTAMQSAHACAEKTRRREQNRQARYYVRRVKVKRLLNVGDRVWMFPSPRGRKTSKFVHQWIGPMRILEPAGYENNLVKCEDKDGEVEGFLLMPHF
ncbi:uncharacterized protein PITG_05959 [Phytophthora infestans T30-4]|uniref:Integrase catalytic domain-containing protein n=1 Tax=Phytophthora infestans (strain T30-4) TaxID=403677 RepID=D0N640_PHYIT|nr:uncharacterized protein PITG_05959 [Phytophthora infestans T30-4]EEY70531.1 conserved hypothetical protein [Phytophthora infestans T30-4]|eukprot:XP_002998185.1 conserved hypothetical protein [Phytophthora infestans T30-4]